MRNFPTQGTTPATVDDDGNVVLQVANKRIARLIQLGIHVEKAAKLKAARRRMQRMSRRNNRKGR